MSRQRATAQSLQLSGLNKIQKERYSKYNMEPGKVIPRDCRLNPPKHYEKSTKQAFKIITSNLIAMGALSEQDLPAFSLMMDALDDYNKLNSLIKLLDQTTEKDDNYFNKRDRLLSRKSKAAREYYLWCSHFGLTPADRTRLSCEPNDTKEKDPLDILLS